MALRSLFAGGAGPRGGEHALFSLVQQLTKWGASNKQQAPSDTLRVPSAPGSSSTPALVGPPASSNALVSIGIVVRCCGLFHLGAWGFLALGRQKTPTLYARVVWSHSPAFR